MAREEILVPATCKDKGGGMGGLEVKVPSSFSIACD